MNILISGGSKGLGLNICEHLLENSENRVFTFARGETDSVRSLRKKYDNFYFQNFDLLQSSEIINFVKKIEADFGLVDCLINNAAVGYDGVLATMHDTEINDSITINITSQILLTKYCIKHMLRLKKGNIINISSILSKTGFNGLSVYGFAKSGQVGFTKSLARELGKVNIRVNCILPGFMETDMTKSISSDNLTRISKRSPMKRLPSTRSISYMVDYLISDKSIDITGETFTIDCGSTS